MIIELDTGAIDENVAATLLGLDVIVITLSVVVILVASIVDITVVVLVVMVVEVVEVAVVVVIILPSGVVIITTPASPLPIELVATTENV